jgi:hypothetical protein
MELWLKFLLTRNVRQFMLVSAGKCAFVIHTAGATTPPGYAFNASLHRLTPSRRSQPLRCQIVVGISQNKSGRLPSFFIESLRIYE